jgi:hypothetical protein
VPAVKLDAQVLLYQALNARRTDLEIKQRARSDCDLDERIEARGVFYHGSKRRLPNGISPKRVRSTMT